MKDVPLPIAFSLALFAALFSSVFFPSVRLLCFAPFLCICYSQKRLLTCLWLSFFSGIVIDLLSTQSLFGLHALIYCITTLLLYRQKRHFFDDKSWALSAFTALFSLVCSSFELILHAAAKNTPPLTFMAIINNTLITSFLDALYAAVWFSLTMQTYRYVKGAILLKLRRRQSEEE